MNESGAHLEAASVQTIGKLNEVLRAQQGIDHYFYFVVMDHYNYIQINVVKHHYFTTFLKWQSSGTTSLHHYFSFISWGFWRATK